MGLENMGKNKNIKIADESQTNKIFIYVIWVILILSPLYVLYFLYSLVEGLPIIYDRIHPIIFFVAGALTLYDIFSVHQIMTSGD